MSPQIRVITKDKIRNGPKAICLPKEIFLTNISMLPTIAPVKKAPKSHTAVHGQPSKLPRNSASFTSPKPIPFPEVKI